jgi:hypothetical protein
MTSVRVRLACLGVLLTMGCAAAAQSIGVSTRLGGQGLGLELSRSVTPQLRARMGFNTHEQDWSVALVDPYDLYQVFHSVSALLDWHPWGDSFRLSGGLLVGSETPDEMRGDDSWRPGYLGVGWDGSRGAGQRLGLVMDLGLVFSSLAETGEVSGDQRGLIPVSALQDGSFSRIWGGLQNQAVFSLGMKYRF